MKKIILLLFTILLLAACQKESTSEMISEVSNYENVPSTARISNKIDVCHNDTIINIHVNAISAHQAHGDAVDMDGDGYFDIDNSCSETDCDDTTYDPDNSCGCVEDELEVVVDPDGIGNSGDEYILYVYPEDNNSSYVIYAPTFGFIGATDILDGDANTDAIVNYHGAGVNYAAGLCASLKIDDCDWYLPARKELEAIYEQLGPNGSNDMPDGKYWHSTEPPNDIYGAFYVNFANGNERIDSKFTGGISCRCVRK